MLKIVQNLRSMNFSRLMEVYTEGNMEHGAEHYPHESLMQQIIYAENDFYQYLDEVFFKQVGARYALWQVEGAYTTALRLEPYDDGLLLSALETRPDARCQGYASQLLNAVVTELSISGNGTLYSHVSKTNVQSLSVHRKSGFEIFKDYAVYLDGSVAHNCYTLRIKY